jgi:hypothetical protein
MGIIAGKLGTVSAPANNEWQKASVMRTSMLPTGRSRATVTSTLVRANVYEWYTVYSGPGDITFTAQVCLLVAPYATMLAAAVSCLIAPASPAWHLIHRSACAAAMSLPK